MTDADKGMNPLHFESDPVDTRINLRIQDHRCLRLDVLAEVYAFSLSDTR